MGRILVVDDEINVIRLLQKFLASKNYDVCTAADGPTAIEKVRALKPQIVLLDILMPGMNGMDTLKEIKKLEPDTVVIMVTAVSDEELAKSSLRLGAFDYITKPINLDYLETCLLVKMQQVEGR
jgi:DNA-binding response OmpR family regulator